jgi:two-component system, OmpR family, response regulator
MARVLVVDDDPWTQRMVSAVLAQAGHLVDLASDGWEALIRAGRRRPDVVITELTLPTTDGWSLAEALRGRPGADGVRFVFLASLRSERTPGPSFRPATDHLLFKPFRLEQVETAVNSAVVAMGPAAIFTSVGAEPAVTRRETPAHGGPVLAGPPRPPATAATTGALRSVLTGSLDEFALSSVLIVLELERKTGVVFLNADRGIGRAFVRQGRVLRAEIDGGAAQAGSLAIFEMLGWSHGRFEFQAGEVSGDDEIGSSTSFLLLEGARLQDERNQGTQGASPDAAGPPTGETAIGEEV